LGKGKYAAKRVSYWRYALYGALMALAIGAAHSALVGTANVEGSAASRPWYMIISAFGFAYAVICVPGALIAAAQANREWRRQQKNKE
jgi:hypothetical protein